MRSNDNIPVSGNNNMQVLCRKDQLKLLKDGTVNLHVRMLAPGEQRLLLLLPAQRVPIYRYVLYIQYTIALLYHEQTMAKITKSNLIEMSVYRVAFFTPFYMSNAMRYIIQ